jgi:hypothetical protein
VGWTGAQGRRHSHRQSRDHSPLISLYPKIAPCRS